METPLDKLIKSYAPIQCTRKEHDKKPLQFVCCDTRVKLNYLEPLCEECKEDINLDDYDDTGDTELQVKSIKNFFETLRDMTKKQLTVINKNQGKIYEKHPLVSNFMIVLDDLRLLEIKLSQIKQKIETKLQELQSREIFEGRLAVQNQGRIRDLIESCIACKDHHSLKNTLTNFKNLVEQQQDPINTKSINFKIKGETEIGKEKDNQRIEQIQEINSKYFKKEMLKYTEKIKQQLAEFQKALKSLFDDKPYDYFNTLHYTFTKFQKMSYECSQKIEEKVPEITFQGSNDESGTSQFIASKDVVTNGVASCSFVIDLYREGHHSCNFLYVGFIKDQPGWEKNFPWKNLGCLKEIYNDCNYPNMRVGFYKGDPAEDNEMFKKMSMNKSLTRQGKVDKITMVCDKEEGSLQIFSPDNQIVFVSRFSPNEVKLSNWRFVIGFLYSAHTVSIVQEDTNNQLQIEQVSKK